VANKIKDIVSRRVRREKQDVLVAIIVRKLNYGHISCPWPGRI